MDIQCGCSNEIWVFSDCSNAFICSEESAEPGESEGDVVSCPEGQVVDVDLTVPPFVIRCTDQVEKCPGTTRYPTDYVGLGLGCFVS